MEQATIEQKITMMSLAMRYVVEKLKLNLKWHDVYMEMTKELDNG